MKNYNILVIAERTPQYEGGSGDQKILYTSYYEMPNVSFCIINDKIRRETALKNPCYYVCFQDKNQEPDKKWRYNDFVKSFSLNQERFIKSEKYISQISEKIKKIIEMENIQVLIFEQTGLLMWSWNRYFSKQIACVLRVHDSHYHNLRLDVRTRDNIMSKLSLFGASLAQKRFEAKHVGDWDQIQFLSTHEFHYYSAEYPEIAEKFSYTPPSIFTGNNKYLKNPTKDNDIIYVGTMSWKPNTDAVKWFLSEVLPLIKKEVSDVRVKIIGKDATKKINCHEKNVEVIGFVESLDEFYQSTKVAINPSKSGGGVKVKLMEYCAFGLPIVTTNLGISGFNDKVKNHLMVKDNPEDFASAIIQLLRDKDLREKYSQHVFDLAQNEFNYKLNQVKWEKEVAKIL